MIRPARTRNAVNVVSAEIGGQQPVQVVFLSGRFPTGCCIGNVAVHQFRAEQPSRTPEVPLSQRQRFAQRHGAYLFGLWSKSVPGEADTGQPACMQVGFDALV